MPAPVALLIPDDGTVTAEWLAKVFGLSALRVRELAAQGIIQRVGRNRYPVVHSIQAYTRYLRERGEHAATGGAGVDPDTLDQFKRKAYYRAELDKLKLSQEAGQLVPLAEVQRDYSITFMLVTQALVTIPDKLEQSGIDGAGVAVAEEVVSAARRELAERLRATVDVDDDGAVRAGS